VTEPYAYCPRCGERLVERTLDAHARPVCPRCAFVHYRNPVPAAGVLLVEKGELLWVQRRFEPRRGGWTLPAGFVEHDEHVAACAVRETREETGLEVEISGLFGAYMAMDDPRARVVLLLYLARRTGGILVPGDDAVAAAFFPIDAPPRPIAFQAHALALEDLRARRRLNPGSAP
jgi:ADP-ribose pyrophosphatase YjhB (NUDIX family)